jgi:hypothetical protein
VGKEQDHDDSQGKPGGVDYTTVGVDIAKNVIQVHKVDRETGEIINTPYLHAYDDERPARWSRRSN